jgi:hypothetical protein
MKKTESLNALVFNKESYGMDWFYDALHPVHRTSLSGAWFTLAKADSHNHVSNEIYMMSTDEGNSM